VELRLVTSALIDRFDVSPATWTSNDSMEMRDCFLMRPKAVKCDSIFKRLNEHRVAHWGCSVGLLLRSMFETSFLDETTV
jgi:hypothetical protein